MSYNPSRGQRKLLQTQVWVAYDDKDHFAFKCLDPEPDKIRTTISRRATYGTTTVGVSLDRAARADGAHMFISERHPDGRCRRNEDVAVDWTWQSAGRVDAPAIPSKCGCRAEHPLQGWPDMRWARLLPP
jgi:hypothetical protein